MIYVLWQKSETEVAIMDITKLVDGHMDLFPELDRVIIANVLLDMFEADMIVTMDSEKDMLDAFPNAKIVEAKGDVKLNAQRYH